jgi:hypothetical protein
MFPVEVFANSLRKLRAILERHAIRFHLTGGITSATYGQPRMTQDVDVVVHPDDIAAQLALFLQSLTISDFLYHEPSIRSAIERHGMFQLLDKSESLKIDVYPREMIPGELDRSETVELFQSEIYPVAARSDAALSKLVWISKGSHKSRADLRSIYRSCDEATRARITEVAAEMNLADLLDKVLAEPNEIE